MKGSQRGKTESLRILRPAGQEEPPAPLVHFMSLNRLSSPTKGAERPHNARETTSRLQQCVQRDLHLTLRAFNKKRGYFYPSRILL